MSFNQQIISFKLMYRYNETTSRCQKRLLINEEIIANLKEKYFYSEIIHTFYEKLLILSWKVFFFFLQKYDK